MDKEKREIEQFFKKELNLHDRDLLDLVVRYSEKKRVKKNQILIREGERSSEIPFLNYGVFKTYYMDTSGKEQIHCFLHLRGELVTGLLNFSLIKMPHSKLTIEAVVDSEIICVPTTMVQELMRNNAEIVSLAYKLLEKANYKTEELLNVIRSYTAEQRYQYFLETYPDLWNVLRKKDIACYLNLTPESLSRVSKKYTH